MLFDDECEPYRRRTGNCSDGSALCLEEAGSPREDITYYIILHYITLQYISIAYHSISYHTILCYVF